MEKPHRNRISLLPELMLEIEGSDPEMVNDMLSRFKFEMKTALEIMRQYNRKGDSRRAVAVYEMCAKVPSNGSQVNSIESLLLAHASSYKVSDTDRLVRLCSAYELPPVAVAAAAGHLERRGLYDKAIALYRSVGLDETADLLHQKGLAELYGPGSMPFY